jgi:hypothetical protein
VIFSEQPPSTQWAPLKYRGETLAEVWFKPESEPFGLAFRVPRGSFQIPGVGPQLTAETLLKSVGIPAVEVESWLDDYAAEPRPGAELNQPLAVPPDEATHLTLFLSLKPPPHAEARVTSTGVGSEIDEAKWQYLEGRWHAILALEANVDNLRMSMEGLRSQLDAAARQSLTLEVKHHALSADMVQLEKTKSRIRYTLPKAREFIHRSTWASGAPERKRMLEVYETHVQKRVPFPNLEEAVVQFESLLKDRQNLAASGTSVLQECKTVHADYQSALRTLQVNASANAARKRDAYRSKGKTL